MFLTTCRISATIFLSGEAPPCQCSQWERTGRIKTSLIRIKKLCPTLNIYWNEPCNRALKSEDKPAILPSDKRKPDLCRRTSRGNGPGEKKRDPTVLEDCLCLHIAGILYRIRKQAYNLIWFLPSAPIRHPCGKWREVFYSSSHQLSSCSLSHSHFFQLIRPGKRIKSIKSNKSKWREVFCSSSVVTVHVQSFSHFFSVSD